MFITYYILLIVNTYTITKMDATQKNEEANKIREFIVFLLEWFEATKLVEVKFIVTDDFSAVMTGSCLHVISRGRKYLIYEYDMDNSIFKVNSRIPRGTILQYLEMLSEGTELYNEPSN